MYVYTLYKRVCVCVCVCVQNLSQSLNDSEEARQLLSTAKTMLEALQQAIDLLKDTQLSGSEVSPVTSVEATPPPQDIPEDKETTGTSEVSQPLQVSPQPLVICEGDVSMD